MTTVQPNQGQQQQGRPAGPPPSASPSEGEGRRQRRRGKEQPTLPGTSAVGRVLPTGSRRYGQWAGAVAFVLVALLGAAWLYLGKGDTVEVLVVDRPVAVGQVIAAEDLTTGQVAGAGEAVPVGRQDEVIGQRAAVGLVPGQLVTANAVTSDPVPAGEERMVALRLADGRVPATVAQGERVSVLAVPPAGDVANDNTLKKPTVLAESVLVHAVKTGADGAVVITVRVPDTEADAVAAFSAAERVTIVQAPAAAPGTGGE